MSLQAAADRSHRSLEVAAESRQRVKGSLVNSTGSGGRASEISLEVASGSVAGEVSLEVAVDISQRASEMSLEVAVDSR